MFLAVCTSVHKDVSGGVYVCTQRGFARVEPFRAESATRIDVTYDCANDCTCVVFPKTMQQPEQHHNTNMSCVACVICSVVLGGLCFRRSHGFDDVACVLFLIRYAL